MYRISKIKTANEPKHVSEWGLRQDYGWSRILECGKLKFIKVMEEV